LSDTTELIRALAALSELPGPEHARLAELLSLEGAPDRADYTSLFVLELPPYASVYLNGDGMLGGEVRDRVAGFWGALGQPPPVEADHVAALLGLYAALAFRAEEVDERGAWLLLRARKALFWEHIACWVPAYLTRAAELAAPAYRSWASVLSAALAQEAKRSGAPTVPPLHFREAPAALPSEFDSVDDLAAALLSPARSGLILARADLLRMAQDLGTGVRVTERRFALSGLIRESGESALAWLADEATRQATLHEAWAAELAPVREFWHTRASRTAAALGDLRAGRS
jgi:TorA maturation chaperone TorD